jgi:hypothetical protein
MNLLHEILGVGLLAGGALVVAAGGLGALCGLGSLERRLVPVRVDEASSAERRPSAR